MKKIRNIESVDDILNILDDLGMNTSKRDDDNDGGNYREIIFTNDSEEEKQKYCFNL